MPAPPSHPCFDTNISSDIQTTNLECCPVRNAEALSAMSIKVACFRAALALPRPCVPAAPPHTAQVELSISYVTFPRANEDPTPSFFASSSQLINTAGHSVFPCPTKPPTSPCDLQTSQRCEGTRLWPFQLHPAAAPTNRNPSSPSAALLSTLWLG